MEIPHGWSEKDNCIFFAVKCVDFKHAIALLNSIGDIAERLNHHPDLGVRNYNEVFVSTSSHDEGKITVKDVELAKEINSLVDHQDNIKQIEQFGRYIA